jgi:hypothetical protein
MNWTLKKSVLTLSCGLLLLSGGTLLVQQIRVAFFIVGESQQINQTQLRVRYSQGQPSDISG